MATFPTYPATTFEQAVTLAIFSGNQLHDVINGDGISTVTTEDGAIPSLRKALLDNFYFLAPIAWSEGTAVTVFNQLYYFSGTTASAAWYFAPTATESTPITMGSTPVGDSNFVPYAGAQLVLDKLNQPTGATLINTSTGATVETRLTTDEANISTLQTNLSAVYTNLADSTGFKYIGQVSTYAALKLVVPTTAGQEILLKAHSTGIAGTAPRGGGKFYAVAGSGTENGGTICVVNSSWYWKRVFDGPHTPEMFGANEDGTDDAPKIINAYNAALTAGADSIKGDNIYTIKSQIKFPGVVHASPSGLDVRQGFKVELNIVIVDTASWPTVPTQWWYTKAVFGPAASQDLENFQLIVNEFDGGGRASFFSVAGGATSTSRIHCGNMRNHIIGFSNFTDGSGQSTMNTISGYNWQNGYMAVLNGGGLQNSECCMVEISWVALHKYTAISLQNRSQYAQVKTGTFDYNGDWAAILYLTNITDTSSGTTYPINFGDTLTIGSKTGVALSNYFSNLGQQMVVVAESKNTRQTATSTPASDYTVGDVITNAAGTFTGTISQIINTSEITAHYIDVIISIVTGAFSRCNIITAYAGGVYGSYMFTNQIWSPRPDTVIGTSTYMGLQMGGGASSMGWYIPDTYGAGHAFMLHEPGKTTFNQPTVTNGDVVVANGTLYTYSDTHVYGNLRVNGTINNATSSALLLVNTLSNVLSFPAASSDTIPQAYDVTLVSNIPGQYGKALVIVNTTSAQVYTISEQYLVLSTDGFFLQATPNGSGGYVTVTSTRIL